MTPRRQGYLRFCAVAAGMTVLILAIGFEPTRRLVGEGGPAAMIAGGLIGLLGSLSGGLAVALHRGAGPAPALTALKVMGLRLVVVVALVVVALGLKAFAPGPLLVWVALSHVALLVVDTRYLIGAVAPADERET